MSGQVHSSAVTPAEQSSDFSRRDSFGTQRLQAKLVVGAINDPLEREADHVAEQVVNRGNSVACANTSPPAIQRASSALRGTDASVPSSVAEVLLSQGEGLAQSTLAKMESSFAHDFGDVRVHRDGKAQLSASAVNARAYTVGDDIVFGQGYYTPNTHTGERLLAHELTHVVQQSAGNAEIVRRDVINDAREKLSYGFLDWAITDTEANDALALLASIPAANLPAELTRLGTKYVSRLLDNLPNAAKSGAVYRRIIDALGSAGTMDHATDQLSYGVFDWAVTNDEVARIFNLFTNLSPVERQKFLLGLENSGKLGRLIENASFGQLTMHLVPWMNGVTRGRLTIAERSIMRTIAKKAPTNPIDITQLATELRYDVNLGPTTIPGRTPVAWDGKKLRNTYLALDHLPDAHVSRNRMLTRFGQFSQASKKLADGKTVIAAGVYNQGQTELAANVKKEGDISSTLIHETGHAVDAEMGWSAGPEPARHSRGGWRQYPGHATCATQMAADSNGGIQNRLNPAQRADVISDMSSAMGNRSTASLKSNIRARAWFAGLSARDRGEVLDDKVYAAISVGLKSPWFTASEGGEHLGNHIYQESYTPTWVRYRHEARSRMVEKYQFRAPGEWFAECYAAYYDINNKVKGDRLKKVDPNTKTYFDNFVDTRATSR